MTLIDEEPDYLSIAPDLSFRSRSRYLDETSGEWVSETEVIESAAELIELYNPADIFAAFADAAREAAGLRPEPTAEGETSKQPGSLPKKRSCSARTRTQQRPIRGPRASQPSLEEDDEESAARRLYDLALEYQERSQSNESRLLEEFEGAAASMSGIIGDLIIVDDDDERLTLTTTGRFRAEVIPEDAQDEWRTLDAADELVEFYDPTDVFGDLADAIAEGYPSVAPELAGVGADAAEGAEVDADADDEAEDGDASEDRPTA